MGATGKRKVFVHKFFRVGNHFGSAFFVEATSALCTIVFRYGISSVQGVIQAAPSCVGCIQYKSCVVERHYQLRSGNGGNLRVNIFSAYFEITHCRFQIVDRLQVALVCVLTEGGIVLMPLINICLQSVACGQVRFNSWSEISNDLLKFCEEMLRRYTSARTDLIADELM